jgi:hypothetical protein
VLDALTDVDTSETGPYQSVDKGLDIYYLSIAYLATTRNWTSDVAFRIARFLFYYRLVGGRWCSSGSCTRGFRLPIGDGG